jgi:DNA-binding NarL/FixJ family response regulator
VKRESVRQEKVLKTLVNTPAVPRLSDAGRTVLENRNRIRKAMRQGHGLDAISRELRVSKRTLQRHLSSIGLFFRKPRTKRGHAVKKNLAAIARAQMRRLTNV